MATMAVERRRAVLVSADAAGYSRLMAEDELATIQTIKIFRQAGEEIALEHSGRLVDAPGDNLLFEFEDPSEALESSLRFQAFVRDTNERFEPEDRMQFRIGMHSGEVVVDSNRIYGSGINIAARLERLARPGGICISDDVRAQLDAPRELEDIGPQYVKNIPYPIHAFFVDVAGQAVPEQRAMSTWPAIAVLPFETADGDSDAEYLADGMTEDLINTLAMRHQFPIIARNSTFLYKGQPVGTRGQGARRRVSGGRQPAARRRARADLGAAARRRDRPASLGGSLELDARGRLRDRRRDRAGDLRRSAARTAQADVRTGHAPGARRYDRRGYALRGLWHIRGRLARTASRPSLFSPAPSSSIRSPASRMRISRTPITGSSSSTGRRIAVQTSPLSSSTPSV